MRVADCGGRIRHRPGCYPSASSSLCLLMGVSYLSRHGQRRFCCPSLSGVDLRRSRKIFNMDSLTPDPPLNASLGRHDATPAPFHPSHPMAPCTRSWGAARLSHPRNSGAQSRWLPHSGGRALSLLHPLFLASSGQRPVPLTILSSITRPPSHLS